jgi:GNAT superfamily N-acetyltransferase
MLRMRFYLTRSQLNSGVGQTTRTSFMTVELRAPATEAEWAAYHTIRRHVLFELRGEAATYDANHPDEDLPGHHPLVLWDAGVAVGVIRVDVQDAVAIFRRVAVPDDLQRRGYGRHLLQAAERFAAEIGCTRVMSHVDPGAVGFYERCGFRRDWPSEAGRAVAMSKRLH